MIASDSDDLYGALDELFTRLMSAGDSESIDALIELDLSFSQVRVLFVLAQRDAAIPINEVATSFGSRWQLRGGTSISS